MDPDVEGVVLHSASLENLKKTHARYFFTFRDLIESMRSYLSSSPGSRPPA